MKTWLSGGYIEEELYESMPPIDFWNTMSDVAPTLSTLATFVLSIAVQSATCERLFSSFGIFHTKTRNRLLSKKTHQLAQIKRQVREKDEAIQKGEDIKAGKRLVSCDELAMVTANEDEDDELRDSSSEDDEDDNSLEYDEDKADDIIPDLPLDMEEAGIPAEEQEEEAVPSRHGHELVDLWVQGLDQLEEDDEDDGDEANLMDANSNPRMIREVLDCQYDDGRTFREENPYPENNEDNGNFPQLKLAGIRATKFELSVFTTPPDAEALYDLEIE
jgi:hypothetical protein